MHERIWPVEANHEALTTAPTGAIGGDMSGESASGAAPAGTAGVVDGLAVEHLADAPERSLLDVVEACERKGMPLKIRTGLSLWNPEVKPYGAFRGWRGQSWILTLKGIEEARKLQQVIELVFDLVRLRGVDLAHQEVRYLKEQLERIDRNNS